MISLSVIYVLFIGIRYHQVHGAKAIAVDSGASSDFSECGVQSDNNQLAVGGNGAVRGGELPWYAGVYTKTSEPYQFICGGTLISHDVIISAAQCFWDDMEQRPPSDYAVAVDKRSRAWDDPQDLNAQKSNVIEITIPHGYRGSAANYQEDIALLKVASPFVFGSRVRPVCLDFDLRLKRKQLKKGNTGKICSWTTTGAQSQVLTTVDIPYVPAGDCLRSVPPGFGKYITSDKICAGGNGTKICRGVGGSGLAFPGTTNGVTRFYLRGIASVVPSDNDYFDDELMCFNSVVVAFTSVSFHEDFISLSGSMNEERAGAGVRS